ncbi:MAG: hypothetical protein V3W44_09990 [Dehalococcoidales bacterium]
MYRLQSDEEFDRWVEVRSWAVILSVVLVMMYAGLNLHVWLIQWAQGRCLPLLFC